MITDVLNSIDSFVWGPPLLVLLIGTGLMLTIRLQLIQFFKLPQALKLIFTAENKGDGDIDSFKALCTALAATVGTGNIVGYSCRWSRSGFLDVDCRFCGDGDEVCRRLFGR